MTLQQAIDHVRQNIADKLSGNDIVTSTQFLSDAINLHVIPHIVSRHDWTWKYDYLDQPLAAGTWKFTPSSPGADLFYDDIYALILKTGNRATTRTIRGRDVRWFLERFPDPSLQVAGRPDWFTVIGESGAPRFEVWLNRPTDAAYTATLVFLKTFAPVALDDELPIRADRHMIVVAGATSYAFASVEQFESAKPWLDLFTSAVDLWWKQDQERASVEVRLGRFRPTRVAAVEDYWRVAQVRGVIAGDTGE